MSGSPLTDRGVTRREAEVLDAVRERLTNAEIAALLYVSERTVESHVSSLLRKLGAGSRRELARVAEELGGPVGPGTPTMPPALELAAESVPLIGRQAELDQLRALWRQATTGHTVVAVVTGEAGIGKSRLVAELSVEVHRDGGTVLLGASFEEAQAPYQPFVQAIADDLRGVAEAEVRRRVADDGPALGRLLPALSAPGTRPSAEIVDGPAQRADVLAALHHYLRRTAENAPTMLVLEDLHWANPTTGDALRHLTRVAGLAPLLVVVTSRDVQPDLTDELSVLLGDLAHSPSVHRVALGGLDQHEVGRLLEWMAARQTGIEPAALHAETGGNPLFVRETVGASVPPGRAAGPVRGLLARRYQRLDGDDLALLDLAAVLGTEFDADLLVAAGGVSLLEVLDALERAEAAGLVAAAPGRPGRFAFVHALFRSSRYDDLGTSRRMRLHQQAAEALAQRYGDTDLFVDELALHACAAVPLGEAEVAVAYARRAGVQAERSLAFDEAAGHYRRALEVADLLDPPDAMVRAQLLVRLGEMLHHAGDPGARAVLERAAAAARLLGDCDLLATVAWAMTSFGQTVVGVFDDFVVSVAEEALAGLGPQPTAARARVLAVLAAEYGGSVDHADRRHDLAREALAVARQVDDPVTLGHVLVAFQWAGWDPDNVDTRLAVAEELVALGQGLGLPVFTGFGHAGRSWTSLELGAVETAWEAGTAYEAVIGDSQMAVPALGIAVHRTTRLYLAGDLDGAELSAERHVDLAAAAGLEPLDYYGPHLMVIRFAQGRLGELLELIEAAAAANTDAVAYRTVLALTLARSGRCENARQILAAFSADGFALLPRDFFWYSGMVSLVDVADLTNDTEAASGLADQLSPFSGRLAVHGIGVSHPIDLALAQVALTLGDHVEAEAFADAAVGASRRMQTPIFLARALLQQAAARQGLGAHRTKIGPLVDEALAIAERTGAGLVEQEAARYQLI